jgi:1,4-alpha-glucan branching enzyme
MLKKKYLKSRKVSKVKFELSDAELPEGIEAKTVHLVGDFNGWDLTATPMKHLKRGAYQATLDLEPGKEYQFRYLVNDEHWYNDWHADAYIPGSYGADNCVVVTPDQNTVFE